ncbi:MAG: FAD-binding oxidoreductase, partial [Candidatus Zixiibacteriota bacterium]
MNVAERLTEILPKDQVSTHPDQLAVASQDESTLEAVTPLAVVWPTTAEDIAEVVRLCIEIETPITTRGAGSALEGSTIPSSDGIVLDVSRMTKIVNLWQDDLQVEVEPGLIYDHL